jgi:hypothetical protein
MSAPVGHGGNVSEKAGSAPPVVIATPDDASHVGVDEKAKRDARLTAYAKGLNYFRVAKYLFFLLAMVGIIILALQVSKGKPRCQSCRSIIMYAKSSEQTKTRSRSSTTRWAIRLMATRRSLRINLMIACRIWRDSVA